MNNIETVSIKLFFSSFRTKKKKNSNTTNTTLSVTKNLEMRKNFNKNATTDKSKNRILTELLRSVPFEDGKKTKWQKHTQNFEKCKIMVRMVF